VSALAALGWILLGLLLMATSFCAVTLALTGRLSLIAP